MIAASTALAAQKDDLRGLKIGMTPAEIEEALPECSNSKVFLADGLSVLCAVKGSDEALDIDLASKGRAYAIEYSFKGHLTLKKLYADTRRAFTLGDAQVEEGRYKWTLPSDSTLELEENRLKLGDTTSTYRTGKSVRKTIEFLAGLKDGRRGQRPPPVRM